MKNILILSIMTCLIFGQSDKIHLPAVKNAIMALESKVAFLESQAGIVEPSNFELAYVELDSIIAQAPDWFYKTPREQCIKYVESIIQALKDNDKVQAISIIDFLILNQTKYFYKSYDRRPITVARFEALKQLIGV